jgi:hypothetical protein
VYVRFEYSNPKKDRTVIYQDEKSVTILVGCDFSDSTLEVAMIAQELPQFSELILDGN